MAILTEIFNTNHIRRWSDKDVKIHNSKDGNDYNVAEDWTDEWFIEHNLTPPTYTETDIPTDKDETDVTEKQMENQNLTESKAMLLSENYK